MGRPVVTGQLPLSPRCFLVAGKLACSAVNGALSTRRARGGKFPEEISDAGAPEGHFLHRRPRLLLEGLDGVEWTPTIRRTATRKRRRQTGDDGQELCDGPAAPNSRPRSEAEWTPERGASPASMLLPGSRASARGNPRPGLPHAPGDQQPALVRKRRSVAGNHTQGPATCGGPPAVTGPERPATLRATRGGRGAGWLRTVRLRVGIVSRC
ncbi:hypothetical protein FHR86_003736 [Paenarthrobacter ilicis]|uniref:Uncharacterized protein n=1 Tax=Paenarthrobacter ilicis TaxID=43665 RepID=A0ABX0TRS5_9MICC|nr:hypothetical protein [Paenarthrobacter ilicis]